MSISRKIKRAVRGEVKPKTVVLEAIRRAQLSLKVRKERESIDRTNTEIPTLGENDPAKQLEHFRNRNEPRFFAGFTTHPSHLLQHNQSELLKVAEQIVNSHSWELLGFGLKNFGKQIEWCRDPLSGFQWPLDYHRDIQLIRNDGSDARVLWELNRLGHLTTLARAYAVTDHQRFSEECIVQLSSWSRQNPYGRGVNWTCAMEVALRSMNLLAVFELLRTSSYFDEESLSLFLRLFNQHGTYIYNNLEFSHISTSNHYLTDVAGLLWLGIMLDEFVDAESWYDLGMAELLSEMDKQILPDGADFESSTGYHRFLLELFLYSFILCKQNDREIDKKYWNKLRSMLEYMRGYLRPDGLAPLIGDSDSGQVLPLCRRRADEHAHVLAIGATLFEDSSLKNRGMNLPQELIWVLGEQGVETFLSLAHDGDQSSESFPNAGTYVMRNDDLYLCFNASDAGLNGRGSHGHNDALSIEISAGGRPFIVDPGTYVYTADLAQRHLFRSTAYHSTVRIDGEEQSTTLEAVPFVIGNEAKPRLLEWETNSEFDRVVAEHYGYQRLSSPVTHRRSIVFTKSERQWLIEDEFFSEGEHDYEVRFHFAPGVVVEVGETFVAARVNAVEMKITALDVADSPNLEHQATSRDYGQKSESITACWQASGKPSKLRWQIKMSPMSDML